MIFLWSDSRCVWIGSLEPHITTWREYHVSPALVFDSSMDRSIPGISSRFYVPVPFSGGLATRFEGMILRCYRHFLILEWD